MKCNLFLGGGGDSQVSYDFDRIFFDSLYGVVKILYIPVAMATTSAKAESCYDWFSKLISQHQGVGREIDFVMWNGDFVINDLSDYSAIYIGGGNTFHLLKVLQQTGMASLLKVFVENGGLCYGGSAGAVILGKSLHSVEEEKNTEDQQDKGLDVLGGFSIFPHFNPIDLEQKRRVEKMTHTHKLPIIAISENGGVIVRDGLMEAFGQVLIFEYEKEVRIYTSGEVI